MTSSYGASGSDWIVCRVDVNSAWISGINAGIYQSIQICNYLGFTNVTAYGGTCGTVCGFCDNGGSGCGTTSNAGYVFEGSNGMCTFPNLCYYVQWLCGNPTSAPTIEPSTSTPTTSAPTTSAPTTSTPTTKPSTLLPTKKPSTLLPTKKPSSLSPTTSKPFKKLPTSRPTKKPHNRGSVDGSD